MNASETNKRLSYTRGSIGNAYLRREYDDYISSGELAEPTSADEAVAAYFDYHVSRLVNLFVLSGVTDIESLATMLTTIVQTTFQVFLSKGREGLRESERISGVANVFYRPAESAATSPDTAAGALGVLGSCKPGMDMIMGNASAEAVPYLDFLATVDAAQLDALRGHPRVLRHLMDALEKAVPLNLDYRVMFDVVKKDHSFKLSRDKKSGSIPSLGITSALGSG